MAIFDQKVQNAYFYEDKQLSKTVFYKDRILTENSINYLKRSKLCLLLIRNFKIPTFIKINNFRNRYFRRTEL